MRLSKRSLMLCVAFTLVAIGFAAAPLQAWAEEPVVNDRLTESEITAQFNRIVEDYEIGESLSPSDEAFVREYASVASPAGKARINAGTNANLPFSISGIKYGTKVTASGSIFHKGTGLLSYQYGGDVTVKKISGKTPQYMTLKIRCSAFGAVGSGGIGLVYSDTAKYKRSNANSFSASPRKSYNGVILYYNVEANVDVKTAEGNFFTVTP